MSPTLYQLSYPASKIPNVRTVPLLTFKGNMSSRSVTIRRQIRYTNPMKKLTGIGKLVFVLVGTLATGAAGLLLGNTIGDVYGCADFLRDSGDIGCSYLYGLIGLGVGFMLTLILGFMLKKAIAVALLLLVVAAILFFSYAPPILNFN